MLRLSSACAFSLNILEMLSFGKELTHYHTIPTLTTLRKKPQEGVLGKGENAGNLRFLLFLHCFLPFIKQISNFQLLNLSSANAFDLDKPRVLSFGNKLNGGNVR